MTRMRLTTASGLECSGSELVTPRADELVVDHFEGWGPVEIDGPAVELVGDGEFSGRWRRRARLVTVGGWTEPETWAGVARLRDLLSALPGGGDRITVEELGGTTWAIGGVRGKPVLEPVYDFGRPFARWEATFKCPDPRRYGVARSVLVPAGRPTAVAHHGTGEARPRYTVVGPQSSGWAITAAGRTVTGLRGIDAGQTVVLDAGTGVGATTDGRLVEGLSGVVPPLPRGESVIEFVGAGSVSVTFTDTYK